MKVEIEIPDNATNGDVMKKLFLAYYVDGAYKERLFDSMSFLIGEFYNVWWNKKYILPETLVDKDKNV